MSISQHSGNHFNTETTHSEKRRPADSPSSLIDDLINDLDVSGTHLQISYKKENIHSQQERSCYEQKEERI